MFNLMEERDVQIKGYRIQLPWTCTWSPPPTPRTTQPGPHNHPLKDRYGSQIRTHYPRNVGDEIAIMEQERLASPTRRT